MMKNRFWSVAWPLGLSFHVSGQQIEYGHLNWVEGEGVIHSINIAERTAVISGYRYTFGHPSGQDQPRIELSGRDHGAFQMLRTGMKVRFHFVAVPNSYRRVLYLRHLPGED